MFSTMTPLILYLNRKSRSYGASILSESEALNIHLMRSIKNFLLLKILGIEQKEKEQRAIKQQQKEAQTETKRLLAEQKEKLEKENAAKAEAEIQKQVNHLRLHAHIQG